MRDHIFKGLRVDGQGWIEGFLLNSTVRSIIRSYIVTFVDDCGSWDKRPRLLFCEVDPATVCEATGLTDKNGVRIFEGDVLVVEGYSDAPVVFSQGAFQRHRAGGLAPLRYFTMRNSETVDGEVLGSIHDPEVRK